LLWLISLFFLFKHLLVLCHHLLEVLDVHFLVDYFQEFNKIPLISTFALSKEVEKYDIIKLKTLGFVYRQA
jgi:hypothetical protein